MVLRGTARSLDGDGLGVPVGVLVGALLGALLGALVGALGAELAGVLLDELSGESAWGQYALAAIVVNLVAFSSLSAESLDWIALAISAIAVPPSAAWHT